MLEGLSNFFMKEAKQKKRRSLSARQGFSIGEVLISSFLLMVGIVAATALIVSNMREAFDARDTIIASQLAQEGIELVHNVRDTNTAKYSYCKLPNAEGCSPLDPEPFDGFVPNTSKKYWIDSRLPTNISPYDLKQGSALYRLYIDQSSGAYVHDTGGGANDTTHFQRRIVMTHTGFTNNNTSNNDRYSDDEVTVYSYVTWNGKTPPDNIGDCTTSKKCAFAKDRLTGWLTL